MDWKEFFKPTKWKLVITFISTLIIEYYFSFIDLIKEEK